MNKNHSLEVSLRFADVSANYVFDPSTDIVKVYGNTEAVPIPSAVWLFGSGLIALLGLERRQSRKRSDY